MAFTTVTHLSTQSLSPEHAPPMPAAQVEQQVAAHPPFYGWLDAPAVGQSFTTAYLQAGGWLIEPTRPFTRLVAQWKGISLPVFNQLCLPRPDVAELFLGVTHAAQAGFSTYIFTNAVLDEEADIMLLAAFEGAETTLVPLTTISISQRQIYSIADVPPTPLKPISISARGRSGTTLVMRYLNAHPQVVTYDVYPFERQMLRDMLHRFQNYILPDFYQFARLKGEQGDVEQVLSKGILESFLSFSENVAPESLEAHWIESLPADAAVLARQSVSRYYQMLARAEKPGAIAFAEKLPTFSKQSDFLRVFPEGHTIVLTRDIRDVFASQQSFNQKRGFEGGWFTNIGDTLGVYLNRSRDASQYSREMMAYAPERVTALRYEDLILQPEPTLTRLFRQCGLSADLETVQAVIASVRAEDNLKANRDHRTTESPQASIGRWKRNLSPQVADAFHAVMGEELAAFGYDVPPVQTPPTPELMAMRLM